MLITAGRAGYKVDWGLGVDVVMSRHCVVKYWPEAFVRVLMRFNDDIHTVLKKQRLEAGQKKKKIQREKLALIKLTSCYTFTMPSMSTAQDHGPRVSTFSSA